MAYRVTATLHGKRQVTSKYWLRKKNAQDYADQTNMYRKNARARVVKTK